MPEEDVQLVGNRPNETSANRDSVAQEYHRATLLALPDRVTRLEAVMKTLENVPEKIQDIRWIKLIGWTCVAAAAGFVLVALKVAFFYIMISKK
jgi:hypothetical protein